MKRSPIVQLHPINLMLALFVAFAAFSAATRTAWADQAGNGFICAQQCNYDSNGNNGSCYSACMANRQSFDGTPGSGLRPMPAAPTLYGGIAVESKSLITGFAKDEKTLADAEKRAIELCHRAGGTAAGCRIIVWGHTTCLALATSQTGKGGESSWGYAWSDDGWVSRRKALAACRKFDGTRCSVAITFCTG